MQEVRRCKVKNAIVHQPKASRDTNRSAEKKQQSESSGQTAKIKAPQHNPGNETEDSFDSEQECDLDCTDGAVAYITAHFPREKRKDLAKIAAWQGPFRLRWLENSTPVASECFNGQIDDRCRSTWASTSQVCRSR